MDLFSSIPPDPRDQREAAPMADPRQPTPDYGALGPNSDVGGDGASTPRTASSRLRLAGPVLAVCAGVILAVLVGISRSAGAGRSHNLSQDTSDVASGENADQLDRLKPQKQAETLLELAVGRSDVALDQISSRVDRWQGRLKWSPQIATLTTAALNSNDTRVRDSGIEIELAAYGLSKNSASLEYLLKTAESSDHAKKIWALWALGLMGNRGVGTPRVIQSLTGHLKDSDVDSRHWSVEGLALIGATESISPLLQVMHDDPAPAVRETAACALAQSGMFTPEQRMAIIPQLLFYTDDPTLDAQTHALAFQALGDITHQHLPNDSAAWRDWYESARSN